MPFRLFRFVRIGFDRYERLWGTAEHRNGYTGSVMIGCPKTGNMDDLIGFGLIDKSFTGMWWKLQDGSIFQNRTIASSFGIPFQVLNFPLDAKGSERLRCIRAFAR
jgi:hypothetical protein